MRIVCQNMESVTFNFRSSFYYQEIVASRPRKRPDFSNRMTLKRLTEGLSAQSSGEISVEIIDSSAIAQAHWFSDEMNSINERKLSDLFLRDFRPWKEKVNYWTHDCSCRSDGRDCSSKIRCSSSEILCFFSTEIHRPFSSWEKIWKFCSKVCVSIENGVFIAANRSNWTVFGWLKKAGRPMTSSVRFFLFFFAFLINEEKIFSLVVAGEVQDEEGMARGSPVRQSC